MSAVAAEVGISVINLGEVHRRAGKGAYEDAVTALVAAPDHLDVIMAMEGRHGAREGYREELAFANALSEATGRCFASKLGTCERGPIGPIMAWDVSRVLTEECWAHGVLDPFDDQRNLAVSRVRNANAQFGWWPQHWSFRDGDRRVAEAKLPQKVAGLSIPFIVAGDLNSAVSGPHEPRRKFTAQRPHKRMHKGRLRFGRWRKDTRSLDTLVGRWVPRPVQPVLGRRRGGIGFFDVAEIAYFEHGEEDALAPTGNLHDQGGRLRTTFITVNKAGKDLYVPGSFQVGDTPAHFTHRIVRCKLRVR